MEKRAGMGKLIKAKSRILLENRRTRESLEKIRIYFISLSILPFDLSSWPFIPPFLPMHALLFIMFSYFLYSFLPLLFFFFFLQHERYKRIVKTRIVKFAKTSIIKKSIRARVQFRLLSEINGRIEKRYARKEKRIEARSRQEDYENVYTDRNV